MSADIQSFRSYAKINARLKVLGRREDGYHLLSMLNFPIDLFDEIRLEVLEKGEGGIAIEASGNISEELQLALQDSDKNLAGRAARIILDFFDLPLGLKINLHKRIPAGGGLGGGSSNAAGILKYLPILLQRAEYISAEQAALFAQRRAEFAISLGADVPYFLAERAACVSGIGEKVTEISKPAFKLPMFGLLLPEYAVSTAAVYGDLRQQALPEIPTRDTALESFINSSVSNSYPALLKLIDNDLLPPALRVQPELGGLFAALASAPDLVAGLSGSGSSVFVFPKVLEIQEKDLERRLTDLTSHLKVKVLCIQLLANLIG